MSFRRIIFPKLYLYNILDNFDVLYLKSQRNIKKHLSFNSKDDYFIYLLLVNLDLVNKAIVKVSMPMLFYSKRKKRLFQILGLLESKYICYLNLIDSILEDKGNLGFSKIRQILILGVNLINCCDLLKIQNTSNFERS